MAAKLRRLPTTCCTHPSWSCTSWLVSPPADGSPQVTTCPPSRQKAKAEPVAASPTGCTMAVRLSPSLTPAMCKGILGFKGSPSCVTNCRQPSWKCFCAAARTSWTLISWLAWILVERPLSKATLNSIVKGAIMSLTVSPFASPAASKDTVGSKSIPPCESRSGAIPSGTGQLSSLTLAEGGSATAWQRPVGKSMLMVHSLAIEVATILVGSCTGIVPHIKSLMHQCVTETIDVGAVTLWLVFVGPLPSNYRQGCFARMICSNHTTYVSTCSFQDQENGKCNKQQTS